MVRLSQSLGATGDSPENDSTGNDVCVIVFQEDDQCIFSPANITSDFNHVFMVVREEIESEDPHPEGATTTTSMSQSGENINRPESRSNSLSGSRTNSQNHIDMEERDVIGNVDAHSARTSSAQFAHENGDSEGEDDSMEREGKDKEKDNDSSADDMSMGSGGVALANGSRRGSAAGTYGNNSVGRTRYRIAITQKEGVPPYGPLVVYPPVYDAIMPRFRSTILKKRKRFHLLGVIPFVLTTQCMQ